jgi:hypothetical protein
MTEANELLGKLPDLAAGIGSDGGGEGGSTGAMTTRRDLFIPQLFLLLFGMLQGR